MQMVASISGLLIIWIVCCGRGISGFALSRSKDYRGPGGGEVVSSKNQLNPEPSCEELKAMWRFSKRQSRAAEITNEIPMYRDPFSDNIWEPYYATSRSLGGMRIGAFQRKPVYGRVVHKPPPYFSVQDMGERHKAFEEVARLYGTVQNQPEPRRRFTTFRFRGGHIPQMYPPQTGSFQHLKELIKTERARELQEQRRAEEAAARAATLKLPNDNGNQGGYQEEGFNYDMEEMQDEPSYLGGRRGANLFAFNDIGGRPEFGGEERFLARDYSYPKGRARHGSSVFDSSYHAGSNGYLL